MTTRIRCYRDLSRIDSFEGRFEYLVLQGVVGGRTFGSDRYLNQDFYSSYEWERTRHQVIARDLGCDMGVPGYEIHDRVYVHHMNPMTVEDIVHGNEDILDPEYLITVTHRTHNAIHYGSADLLVKGPVVRRPGDTKLW